MNQTFPQTYIPEYLEKLNKGIVQLPIKPIEPKEPVKVEKVKIPLWFHIFFLSGFIFYEFGIEVVYFFIWGIYGLVIFLAIYEITQFKKKKIKYESEFKEFEVRRNRYLKEIDFYDSLFPNKNDPDYDTKLKQNLTLGFFKDASTFKLDYKSYKGRTEQYFKFFLEKYFPGEVFTEKIIETFEDKLVRYSIPEDENEEYLASNYYDYEKVNPYCPDFIIKLSNYNFHIDIEIDEPYHKDKPLHYKNLLDDIKRNNYFLNKRWVVIRFSEEQIVYQPTECCYFIAQIIFEIIKEPKYIPNFNKRGLVREIKIWTKDEAMEMARIDYRENYLRELPN